jgi:hypothetical protein
MGGVYSYGSWYGPNYMPIGGQYLMDDEDATTKISSSFNGRLDGGGYFIYNIYCDRHCAGNYGDGQSVGLIGRLGNHDSDPVEIRGIAPSVKNLAITGYIKANRSVGGIVGKIGKTDGGATIDGCANYATVIGTDSKGTGGICGAAWNGGVLSNCYNAGDITNTGIFLAGGIAASAEIAIKNCYNIGIVSSGKSSFAMAIGTNNGGAPAPVNCYYLEGTALGGGWYSGSALNSGKKTSAEMKEPAFAELLGAAFTPDTTTVNKGYPLLEALNLTTTGPEEPTYVLIAFNVVPTVAQTSVVVKDSSGTVVAPEFFTVYSLVVGDTYSYTVSAPGYTTRTDIFTVSISRTITILLATSATVDFSSLIPGFTVSVAGSSGVVAPLAQTGDGYSFALDVGASYTYTATASGYNGISREFIATDGAHIAITLTSSEHPEAGGAGDSAYLIYGSANVGMPHTITAPGTYYIGKGAAGTLTIDTQSPVTLVGTGTSHADAYENLYIKGNQESISLTLRDVYIANTIGIANMIDYQGQNNKLLFSGTSILDQNTGASGYAMVHVNTSTSLTVGGVTDADTLYFYKREQSAGIGGNSGGSGSEGQAPEYNGTITITGGNLFMKNSKQGALIGSGANASSTDYTPGDIYIKGGTLNLIAISRGAAIGGSAGSSGGAKGTDVYIYPAASVNINVDFSGAAIGGGGYSGGNDSGGGILHYLGGSVRTFIDYNAVNPTAGTTDGSSTLWPGVTVPGVNDIAITAAKVRGTTTQPVHLLAFDTTQLSSPATSFTVTDEGAQLLYSGGLHAFAYVNENLQKDSQIAVNYTIDNWVVLDDPNLYLYLTAASHTLSINNERFSVEWDAQTSTFSVTAAVDPGEQVGLPGSGDLFGTGTVTLANAIIVARALIGLDNTLTPAQIAAADMDGSGALTMADMVLIMRKAAGL